MLRASITQYGCGLKLNLELLARWVSMETIRIIGAYTGKELIRGNTLFNDPALKGTGLKPHFSDETLHSFSRFRLAT
jgi:hypothetical protein